MVKLFTAMMKEEWRIHSTIFGSLSFALFPVLIFGIAFMGSFLIPLFHAVLPSGDLATVVHAIFLLLGVMVGAFGLIGAEAMNRRFGQASLLAYSARSLPITERIIFLNFVLKDTVYYFILWVLPFVCGFAVASPFLQIPLTLSLLLLGTLTLSFLTGLSIVFFLSTIYTRSKMLLVLIFLISVVGITASLVMTGFNLNSLYPPLMLFSAFTWPTLAVAAAMIIVPFTIAILLFTSEYADTTKRYRNAMKPLADAFSFFPYPPLAAKDLLDLTRSGGLFGQTIFSFLIPLGLLWFLLSIIARILPAGGVLLLFAILTGIIASTMYTWLTAFDTFSSYANLPIGTRTLLTSKVTSFLVLQLIPVGLIIVVGIVSGGAAYLIPALVLGISVSIYSLGVTIWLTGLSPNVLVYDAKVLMSYLVLVGIVIVTMIAVAFINPYFALVSLVLLLPAWLLVRQGFIKWEEKEQPGF